MESNENTKILPPLLAHGMGHEIACVLLTSKRTLRPQQALSPLSCPQFVSEKSQKKNYYLLQGAEDEEEENLGARGDPSAET